MRAFDLFCGMGGSSFGARSAGVEIIGGLDRSKVALSVFAKNFPNALTVGADAAGFDFRSLGGRLGSVDLLMASPECTSHSCAKGSNPGSERSRESAFFVLAAAQAWRPRFVVVENVISMRRWIRYREWLDGFDALDYNVTELILDAADYGVPQSRRRLFVVADQEQAPLAPLVSTEERRSASEIIDMEEVWPASPVRKPSRAVATLERYERAISELGQDESFLLVYYGTDGAGGWQRLNRPLRTVTTIDRFALVAPRGDQHVMRMLQPTELERAMGFPDKITWPNLSRREKIGLIGNAVCSPVMMEIVRAMRGAQ